jgi:hypothetical protein
MQPRVGQTAGRTSKYPDGLRLVVGFGNREVVTDPSGVTPAEVMASG